MALYEYYCDACRYRFEELTAHREAGKEAGFCPKCKTAKSTRRLYSRFAISGQGDLRETTMHGCHPAHVSLGDGSHGHDHDHDHGHDHGHGDGGSGGGGDSHE